MRSESCRTVEIIMVENVVNFEYKQKFIGNKKFWMRNVSSRQMKNILIFQNNFFQWFGEWNQLIEENAGMGKLSSADMRLQHLRQL